jgi:serine/threonine-protein kinase
MYDGWKIVVISLIVAIIVSIGVCSLFFFVFVPYWEGRGVGVEVPQVTDLTLEEASLILNNRGLLITIEKAEDSSIPEGMVISQSPPANFRMRRGEPVKLMVSSGAPLVEVPSLEAVSLAEAVKLLDLNGLEAGQTKRVISESIPAEHVISTNPQGGTMVERGSVVDLTVSIGREQVSVPKLFGKSLASAKSALAAKGLKLGSVTSATDEEYAFDIIISQFPKSGNQVSKGSAVDVVVNRESP